jgi:hypothetical protein
MAESLKRAVVRALAWIFMGQLIGSIVHFYESLKKKIYTIIDISIVQCQNSN